jgi:multidrug efflux pump subunit AcrB
VDSSTSAAATLYLRGRVHSHPNYGGLAIVRTPSDIFPTLDIPVVSIIGNYNGFVPQKMRDRVVSVTQRALTNTVDNIEHVELQSLYGIAVVKVFLQPTANLQQGIAQITVVSRTQLKQLACVPVLRFSRRTVTTVWVQ